MALMKKVTFVHFVKRTRFSVSGDNRINAKITSELWAEQLSKQPPVRNR